MGELYVNKYRDANDCYLRKYKDSCRIFATP